jgi:hypothetical protein
MIYSCVRGFILSEVFLSFLSILEFLEVLSFFLDLIKFFNFRGKLHRCF